VSSVGYFGSPVVVIGEYVYCFTAQVIARIGIGTQWNKVAGKATY